MRLPCPQNAQSSGFGRSMQGSDGRVSWGCHSSRWLRVQRPCLSGERLSEQREARHRQVSDRILDLIESGRWLPGSKIPSWDALAREFGCSEADVEGLIGTSRHERSADRTTWRNGYRARTLETRLGLLNLKAPKLRTGSYPGFSGTEEARREGSRRGDPRGLRHRCADSQSGRARPGRAHERD